MWVDYSLAPMGYIDETLLRCHRIMEMFNQVRDDLRKFAKISIQRVQEKTSRNKPAGIVMR